MADIKTAKRLYRLANHYRLSGCALLRTLSFQTLANDFNGIGPEWFPERLRKVMDALSADLLPVAFVHDVRWSHSDGSFSYFAASNAEFKANGYAVARAKYPWWRPARYLRMNEARVFGNLCQAFGWSAYRAAYEKQKGRNR